MGLPSAPIMSAASCDHRSSNRPFRSFRDGGITAEAFRDIQDKCIRDVVALQEEAGLQSITDGEFRRASYWAHFVEKVDGFGVEQALFTFGDADEQSQEFLASHVTDKVRRTHSISGDELDFLRGATRHTPKLTLPSPPTMHFWRGPGRRGARGL